MIILYENTWLYLRWKVEDKMKWYKKKNEGENFVGKFDFLSFSQVSLSTVIQGFLIHYLVFRTNWRLPKQKPKQLLKIWLNIQGIRNEYKCFSEFPNAKLMQAVFDRTAMISAVEVSCIQ